MSNSNSSLHVSGIPLEITEQELSQHFLQIGQIASIRICRDKVTRKSLGYCYVNYEISEHAKQALDRFNFVKVNPNLPNIWRVSYASPDPTHRRNQAGNLCIKQLHKDVDDKVFHDTFSRYGNILSSKVSCSRETGESNGYGFVHFQDINISTEVLAHANEGKIEFLGQPIVAELFKPISERPTGVTTFTNVYSKNFPLSWTEEQFTQYFSEFGTITSAKLALNEDGSSRGFGFVNFSTHDEAVAAVTSAHGKEILDGELKRVIYAARCLTKAERRFEIEKTRAQYIANIHERTAGCNLYIKHIVPDASEEEIVAFFSQYGSITSYKVLKLEDGSNTGVAFVCYSHPQEATLVYNMFLNHQLIFNNRPIYVNYFTPKHLRRIAPYNSHNNRSRRQPRKQFPERVARRVVCPLPANVPSLQELDKLDDNDRKQSLGELLYPMVEFLLRMRHRDVSLAPKITGMLLEMNTQDVLVCFTSSNAIENKVNEALDVLDNAASVN